MVESDIGELYKYYRGFGYMDVKISVETQRSADGSEITLIFHIQEGIRYKIQDVPDVHGTQTVPREQLIPLSLFKPGDYLDESKLKGDALSITRLPRLHRPGRQSRSHPRMGSQYARLVQRALRGQRTSAGARRTNLRPGQYAHQGQRHSPSGAAVPRPDPNLPRSGHRQAQPDAPEHFHQRPGRSRLRKSASSTARATALSRTFASMSTRPTPAV